VETHPLQVAGLPHELASQPELNCHKELCTCEGENYALISGAD